MARRKRIIYQSESILAGPSPATGVHNQTTIKELTRVQSFSHSLQITKQDINQFGQLAAYAREIIDAPTVTADLSYYLTNGGNENKLGFVTNGQVSAISGFLNGTTDERNIFCLDSSEGTDSINNSDRANHIVTAIGNCFISNYSIDASVGQPATATVSFEALNINYERNSSGNYVPNIIPESGVQFTGQTYVLPIPTGSDAGQVSALRPGDIELQLFNPIGASLSGESSAHIQSFSLSVPLSRENLDRLGSKFSFSKEITFPVTVTLNVTANMADIVTGNLSEYICEDLPINAVAIMREPSCGAAVGAVAFRAELKNAKLDSQSQSLAIGSSKTVDLSFSAQLSGPEDLENGLFISGSYSG
jgi:hypothetical protein